MKQGDQGSVRAAPSRDERFAKFCKQVEWAGLRDPATRDVFNDLFPDHPLDAAAPEMLAALKECASRLKMAQDEIRILLAEVGREDDEQNQAADEADTGALMRAAALIAKAEGKS